jgi:hypothetical protein
MGIIGVAGMGVDGGFGGTIHGFNALLRFEANIRISTKGSKRRAFVEKGSSEKYGDASNLEMYYTLLNNWYMHNAYLVCLRQNCRGRFDALHRLDDARMHIQISLQVKYAREILQKWILVKINRRLIRYPTCC